MGEKACAHCKKRPSEVQGGGKFQVCSGCGITAFCSAACQKSAWPIHKIICRASVANLGEFEVESLRRPLTTGLIMSRAQALKTDIHSELSLSLASAFRAQLLSTGRCLFETHAAHLEFTFDRHQPTVRKQFTLVRGSITTIDDLAKRYLYSDPLLPWNLSPTGFRAWHPSIDQSEATVTIPCFITIRYLNVSGHLVNTIFPVEIEPLTFDAMPDSPELDLVKLAALEADEDWLQELQHNLEQPSNEWRAIRTSHIKRRVNEYQTRTVREEVDKVMAELGDSKDWQAVIRADIGLFIIGLHDKPDDPNYEYWNKAHEKVVNLSRETEPEARAAMAAMDGMTLEQQVEAPCCFCLKRPSEVQGGGEFPVCSRCHSAAFCSSACQKSAWPVHKTICSLKTKQRNTIEIAALSNPSTTGLIVARGQALQLDISNELRVSLASAFRVDLLSTGGCLSETHAAHLSFRFDRSRSTVRKQFRLTFAQIETFDKIAEPFLSQNGADPRLAYNLSPQGLRAWNPWIDVDAEKDQGRSVTVACLMTAIDDEGGYYNMILPVPIHDFNYESDDPGLTFTKLALLEPDDGWLEELKANLERPRNDFQEMRVQNVVRRVEAFRERTGRKLIEETMERLGDTPPFDEAVGALLLLQVLKLEEKTGDPNYKRWKKAMAKVESLMMKACEVDSDVD
ncbi:hypothetical protein RQP46_005784 [Phenoliferia psychrophenolica]